MILVRKPKIRTLLHMPICHLGGKCNVERCIGLFIIRHPTQRKMAEDGRYFNTKCCFRRVSIFHKPNQRQNSMLTLREISENP